MLAIGGAALVTVAALFLVAAAISEIVTGVRFLGYTDGLSQVHGALKLAAGGIGVLVAAAAALGLVLAAGGQDRFILPAVAAGLIMLAWSSVDIRSALSGGPAEPRLAWIVAVGSGLGIGVLATWWISARSSR